MDQHEVARTNVVDKRERYVFFYVAECDGCRVGVVIYCNDLGR